MKDTKDTVGIQMVQRSVRNTYYMAADQRLQRSKGFTKVRTRKDLRDPVGFKRIQTIQSKRIQRSISQLHDPAACQFGSQQAVFSCSEENGEPTPELQQRHSTLQQPHKLTQKTEKCRPGSVASVKR